MYAEEPEHKEVFSVEKTEAEETDASVVSSGAPLSKLEQFQLMMNEIVRNAIAENNQALGHEVSSQVGERVLKEMNYLMREREEQEESGSASWMKRFEAAREGQGGKKQPEERKNPGKSVCVQERAYPERRKINIFFILPFTKNRK